jgi:hypothetical protein
MAGVDRAQLDHADFRSAGWPIGRARDVRGPAVSGQSSTDRDVAPSRANPGPDVEGGLLEILACSIGLTLFVEEIVLRVLAKAIRRLVRDQFKA